MPCGASRRRGRWHSAHALLCARRSRSGRLGVTVSRRPSRGGRAAPRCAACMPPVSGRAPRWLPSLRRHYERAACACHASRCISSVAPGSGAAAQGSAPAPLLGLAKPHAGGRHLSADHGSPSFSKLTREQQCLKWLKTVPAGEGLVCKRLSSFLRAADLPSSRGGSPAGRAFRLRYNTHRTRPPRPRRWSRLLTPGVSPARVCPSRASSVPASEWGGVFHTDFSHVSPAFGASFPHTGLSPVWMYSVYSEGWA